MLNLQVCGLAIIGRVKDTSLRRTNNNNNNNNHFGYCLGGVVPGRQPEWSPYSSCGGGGGGSSDGRESVDGGGGGGSD